MSARAVPVAARLSAKQLRFLRAVARAGEYSLFGWWKRTAMRLAPTFITIVPARPGKWPTAIITDAGQAVIASRR